MSADYYEKLDKVSKRYLRRERKALLFFLFVGYSMLGCATVYFWVGDYSKDLGYKPPLSSIHNQSASEQRSQITKSELGRSGGLPLSVQVGKGGDATAEPQEQNTPLSYLADLRDLDAQEGVWKASRVIAVIAFIQTLIGVAGLILIYGTLKETQLVGNEAKKTTRQALRAANASIDSNNFQKRNNSPILFFNAKITPPDKSIVEGQYQVDINFGNNAQAPATDMRIKAFLVSKTAFLKDDDFEVVSNGQPINIGSIASYTIENAFQILLKSDFPFVSRRFKKLYVVVIGTYRTLFEPEKDQIYAGCERIMPFDINQITIENQMRLSIEKGDEPPTTAAPTRSIPTNFQNFRGQMVDVDLRNRLVAFCETQKIGGMLIPMTDDG